jgi:hypothetical protein
MDPRLKKRIIAFYFAGFLNLVLGLYVLINGRALVEPTTWLVLLGCAQEGCGRRDEG